MATISSTTSGTSTATPTPTATTAANTNKVNRSAANSILTSLGSGSGIDTDTVVTGLVEAQFAAQRARLSAKQDTLTAQISSAATVKNFVSDFAKALDTLVNGDTLAVQTTSSDTKVMTATGIPGVAINTAATTTINVTALASAQSVTSGKFVNTTSAPDANGKTTTTVGSATPFDAGKLTIKVGTLASDGTLTPNKDGQGNDVSIDIAITPPNNTLTGIANSINAQKVGISASIITDADGSAYLSLKGQTGKNFAFTMRGDNPSLQQLDVGVGGSSSSVMTNGTAAANSKMTVDGVPVERDGNEVSDLISGMTLELTATGTTTLSAKRADTGLTNAVNDFVDTFNQLLTKVKDETNAVTGNLRQDVAAKSLLRSLQSFSGRTLISDALPGTPSTLVAIGVTTNKDTGLLEVDKNALAKAVKQSPDAIQAMFSPSKTGSGLNAAMQTLDTTTSSVTYGLGATNKRLTDEQSDVTKKQSDIDDQATKMTTRLTQQYASMNARVTAYKATQAFMKQQVDSWYKSN